MKPISILYQLSGPDFIRVAGRYSVSMVLFLALASARAWASGAGAGLPEKVTFNAHIRPILSDKCYSCHGFDAKHRQAGFRIDTAEGAFAAVSDSKEGQAIVPGKPEASAILARMRSPKPSTVMPPPEFHKPVSPRDIALIERWITQGAKYENHWAFAPIVRPPAPKSEPSPAAPIDAFIGEKLASAGLKPSPEADKPTLLRRLSLDLTGLPPAPEEVAAFVADAEPGAYERQVERLLASPHYGERMAVPWLDAVRYADTVGYHGDQNARIFPYRDYVIQAFNTNKPFDQFTTEQLAGDLLPNPTNEQRIATGFLRLNLMTREGGAQAKEYLAKYASDRVRALGAAWLGLTTGCAQCHDHKFDPLTTKEFYAFSAFFADIRQWGIYTTYNNTPNPDLPGFNNESPFPPEIYSPNQAQRARLDSLRLEALHHLAGTRANATDAPEFRAWVDRQTTWMLDHPEGWQSAAPTAVTTGKDVNHEIQDDGSVVFTGPVDGDGKLVLQIPLPDHDLRTIRLEVLPGPKTKGKVGRGPEGTFKVTPTFAMLQPDGKSAPIEIAWQQADRRSPHKYRNGEESPLLEAEWRSAPARWEEPGNATELPHHAHYHLATPLAPAAGRLLVVTLATPDLATVRVSFSPFADTVPGDAKALDPSVSAALLDPVARDSIVGSGLLLGAWAAGTTPEKSLDPDYVLIRSQMQDCRAGFAHSLIATTLPPDQIPTTHLLPRGDWMNPAEEIKPGFPAFLPPLSNEVKSGRLDRLDLARWLTSPQNPLTARHVMNRTWKQFFGQGLSNVLDDLGNQGEWPSHPELLDWLASEFRQSGWDMKHMVRLMVTSSTYRQVSAQNPERAERDPYNRLLSEQSARRLDAEFIRDHALAVAGLLSDDIIGGPSAKPYQPDGYYANLNFPIRDYAASLGREQYRRGVYMHWQRTFLHPMLAAFDAPSRDECAADRFQSNSPQQALTLLNDPSFVETARGFALRLFQEAAADTGERITRAYRIALARDPKPAELASLKSFVDGQKKTYTADPQAAAAFLKVGAGAPIGNADPVELAAWTQLCRVLLNLHESLTRY